MIGIRKRWRIKAAAKSKSEQRRIQPEVIMVSLHCLVRIDLYDTIR
jgi:hypothetical protein